VALLLAAALLNADDIGSINLPKLLKSGQTKTWTMHILKINLKTINGHMQDTQDVKAEKWLVLFVIFMTLANYIAAARKVSKLRKAVTTLLHRGTGTLKMIVAELMHGMCMKDCPLI
jgi:phage tail sheath protein FI